MMQQILDTPLQEQTIHKCIIRAVFLLKMKMYSLIYKVISIYRASFLKETKTVKMRFVMYGISARTDSTLL